MNWFVAPRYIQEGYTEVTVGSGGVEIGVSFPRRECPGAVVDGAIVPYVTGGMICRAYDAAAGTVLVGLRAGVGVPAPGWTQISTEQARARFEAVYGRPPSAAEVR